MSDSINIPNLNHLISQIPGRNLYDFGKNRVYKAAGILLAVQLRDSHRFINGHTCRDVLVKAQLIHRKAQHRQLYFPLARYPIL